MPAPSVRARRRGGGQERGKAQSRPGRAAKRRAAQRRAAPHDGGRPPRLLLPPPVSKHDYSPSPRGAEAAAALSSRPPHSRAHHKAPSRRRCLGPNKAPAPLPPRHPSRRRRRRRPLPPRRREHTKAASPPRRPRTAPPQHGPLPPSLPSLAADKRGLEERRGAARPLRPPAAYPARPRRYSRAGWRRRSPRRSRSRSGPWDAAARPPPPAPLGASPSGLPSPPPRPRGAHNNMAGGRARRERESESAAKLPPPPPPPLAPAAATAHARPTPGGGGEAAPGPFRRSPRVRRPPASLLPSERPSPLCPRAVRPSLLLGGFRRYRLPKGRPRSGERRVVHTVNSTRVAGVTNWLVCLCVMAVGGFSSFLPENVKCATSDTAVDKYIIALQSVKHC